MICFLCLHYRDRSRDSSVSVVTRPWAGRLRFDFREGQIFFCLLHRVQTDSEAHLDCYPMDEVVSFPGKVKRPGREPDHSPPSSVEVKNAWNYNYTPQYVFIAWCLVKHRDTYIFYLLPVP